MKPLLSRIVLAGLLAVSVMGCRHSLSYSRSGHVHRHDSGAEVVFAGLLLGAAIGAAAASTPPEPEPQYYSNVYYVYGPPPAPLPRSARDNVEQEVALASFDPHAARVALNGIDVSSCREAGAPKGFGHAKVVINPDGKISKVIIDEPAGMATDAAKCVGDRLGTATVPPFKGSLVTMGTTYHVK